MGKCSSKDLPSFIRHPSSRTWRPLVVTLGTGALVLYAASTTRPSSSVSTAIDGPALALHREEVGDGQGGASQLQGGLPYTKQLVGLPDQRAGLGAWLEKEGYRVGAELGVQAGHYANVTLADWPSCTDYYLVDLWRNFPSGHHYDDSANANNDWQSELFWGARALLEPYRARTKLHFMPMMTIEASEFFKDESLDYVYVDARHDYCGVMQDLREYWPKVRDGGVMAGHDFVYANQVSAAAGDWSLCEDGTKNPGAVKGAVEDFAKERDLKVESIWKNEQPSWVLRKPHYTATTASR